MTDWWVYVKLDTALPDDQTTALLAVGAVTIDHVRTHTEIDANVAASTLPLAHVDLA